MLFSKRGIISSSDILPKSSFVKKMKLLIISFISNNLFIISKIYSEVISDEMNKIVFLFLIVAFNKNGFITF